MDDVAEIGGGLLKVRATGLEVDIAADEDMDS
jgi:hypothetical protein